MTIQASHSFTQNQQGNLLEKVIAPFANLSRLSFQFSWANAIEKQWLESEMKKLSRQRMNLTVMTEAQFLLLKTNDGKIIGWAGMDMKFNPKFPEFFSLHLDPAFRNFNLGLLMESVRATYFLNQNIRTAYVRMAKDSTYRLLMKRLDSKFYVPVNLDELEDDYLNLCRKCNLYGNSCQERVFLKFDIARFAEHSESQIGPIDLTEMPMKFRLKAVPIEACDPQPFRSALRRSYHPIWD